MGDDDLSSVIVCFCCLPGVKGLILGQSQYNDSLFLPLEGAVVVVQGRESVQFRSTKYGEYFKLLLPGKYILQVRCLFFL